MIHYSNFEEISHDLKRLNLERQIALEELKGLKQEVKEDFSTPNWLGTIASFAKKYGIMYLLRRLFK